MAIPKYLISDSGSQIEISVGIVGQPFVTPTLQYPYNTLYTEIWSPTRLLIREVTNESIVIDINYVVDEVTPSSSSIVDLANQLDFMFQSSGGGGSSSWGSITGTITNQTDLMNLLLNYAKVVFEETASSFPPVGESDVLYIAKNYNNNGLGGAIYLWDPLNSIYQIVFAQPIDGLPKIPIFIDETFTISDFQSGETYYYIGNVPKVFNYDLEPHPTPIPNSNYDLVNLSVHNVTVNSDGGNSTFVLTHQQSLINVEVYDNGNGNWAAYPTEYFDNVYDLQRVTNKGAETTDAITVKNNPNNYRTRYSIIGPEVQKDDLGYRISYSHFALRKHTTSNNKNWELQYPDIDGNANNSSYIVNFRPNVSGTVAYLSDITGNSGRVLEDDFNTGTTEAGEVGNLGWSFTNGTIVNYVAVLGNSPSVIRRTSLTSGVTNSTYLGSGPAVATVGSPDNIIRLDFKIQIKNNLTNANHLIGFGDLTNGGVGPNEFIGFRFINGTPNWIAICRAGGIETSVNTGVVVSFDVAYTFSIVRISSTNFEFYINNTLVATITTNIPGSLTSLPVGHAMVNITGLSTDVWFEYFKLQYTL